MDYKNYITCFADRSKKVLEKFPTCDPKNELNVTALISVATTAFIIPFERLGVSHPFEDKILFEELSALIKTEEKKKCTDSDLFSGKSWIFCKNNGKKTLCKSDLGDLSFENLCPEQNVEEMIKIIRNALTHGNIVTGISGCTIETLYFASRINNNKECEKLAYNAFIDCQGLTQEKMMKIIRKLHECNTNNSHYKILQCSIEDFRTFLYAWIDLLSSAIKTPKENC